MHHCAEMQQRSSQGSSVVGELWLFGNSLSVVGWLMDDPVELKYSSDCIFRFQLLKDPRGLLQLLPLKGYTFPCLYVHFLLSHLLKLFKSVEQNFTLFCLTKPVPATTHSFNWSWCEFGLNCRYIQPLCFSDRHQRVLLVFDYMQEAMTNRQYLTNCR